MGLDPSRGINLPFKAPCLHDLPIFLSHLVISAEPSETSQRSLFGHTYIMRGSLSRFAEVQVDVWRVRMMEREKVNHRYAVAYLIKMLLYYRDLGFILVFLNLFCSFFLPPPSPSLLSNPYPSSLLSIFHVTWHLLLFPLSHISFAPSGFPIKSHSHTHSQHPCPMYSRALKGWI